MYKLFGKRILDFVVALLLFIMSFPLLLVISLILAISIKGNPFFVQKRPGKHKKIFSLLKLKSMTDKKNDKGELLPDSERITALGRLLRKTSVDELPQLLNILKGDMSFVGPRPLLVRYLPYYTAEEQLRHTVRPGITGLAQTSGRNLLDWDTRLSLDVKYVNTLSATTDLGILLNTVKKVISSDGVIVDPNSVMIDLDEQRK